MKKDINRYVLYLLCALGFLIIGYGMLSRPQLQLRIIYRLGQHTAATDYLLLDCGQGYQEADAISGQISREKTAERRMFDMFFKVPPVEGGMESIQLRLQPRNEDEDDRIQIRTIELWNRNVSMKKYSPDQLLAMFAVSNANDAYVEGERFCIEPIDSETYVTLEADEILLNDFAESEKLPNTVFWNLFIAALLFLIMLMGMDAAWHHREYLWGKIILDKKGNDYWFQMLVRILMLGALICVAVMALTSKHYAHPDEDVSRLAIDYYMTHWLPPDMRDISVLGTFSNYGATRLTEPTLYYLIAGKLGWIGTTIFHIDKYYRMLNVILFAIMTGTIVFKKSRNLWMLIGIGITPQIWYLFSYATSDAWDFFWSFWIIYELLEKESALQRFLTNRSKHPVCNVLWISFLFSMIFRGKQNYYLILLFAFIILVIRWCRQSGYRLQLLVRYIIIAVTSILFLLPHTGIERYSHQRYETRLLQEVGSEDEVIEIAEKREMQRANEPVTEVVTRRSMGYSFMDVAIKDLKGIMDGITNSGVGSYGWLEYYMPNWYSYGVVGLYGILALLISYHLVRERRWQGCLDTGVMFTMILITYLMMVYLCWSGEFQTQGRYILMLSLIIGYTGMQSQQIYEDKLVRGLITMLICISIGSYLLKGMCNLI